MGAATLEINPQLFISGHFLATSHSNSGNYSVYITLKEEDGPFNLFSDSMYVVNLLPWLATSFAWLDENLSSLLMRISSLVQWRTSPLFVQHVQSYTPSPPGPVSEGNSLSEQVASMGVFIVTLEQSKEFTLMYPC